MVCKFFFPQCLHDVLWSWWLVPGLKEPNYAFCTFTLAAAATTHVTLLATYLASFTLAKVVIKAYDAGLETADAC